VQPVSAPTLRSRTIGVLPTSSSTVG
jgi:hypothetical protein